MIKTRFLVIIGMILAAMFSRLIPHPPNFVPLSAIALFSGAYFSSKKQAFILPLLALFFSDLILGFHSTMPVTYLSFILIIFLGFWLKEKKSAIYIAEASVASSLLFFIITNFGVWAFTQLYPKTIAGLLTCYVAAIPFFHNALLGDLFYTGVLFGGFALIEKRFFNFNRVQTISA